MITKTRGIVIKYIKYGETSIIVKVFTEELGLVSCMVNGIRSSRSRRSMGYFQPFSLLELILYSRPNREIQRLSEFKYFAPAHRVQQDIRKGTIALFLAEVLSKSLVQESGEDPKRLFDFLVESILTLDRMDENIEHFHLHFLLKLLPFVGIGIDDGTGLIHNMELEQVENDERLIQFISSILNTEISTPMKSSGETRFKALELVLNYYSHHTATLGEIKSLKVLHQVFR